MLFFKLLKLGVHGNFYKAITSLYLNPQSRVNLNGLYTNYFDCPLGVKQGDCLSPTLFAIFINDLAEEIRNSGLGVKLECGPLSSLTEVEIVSILLYADDIILLADSEADLQALLTIVENWCKRCRLEVNLSKTNVMHVRKKRTPQSRFVFLLNKQPVAYSSSYKYLGINIDEHLDIKYSVSCQSDAAGRALSVVVTKMIKNGGFPFKLYEMLYNSCVCSVADYTAPVTGYQEFESTMKLHLKAIRAYLGVPKNACNVGVLSEVNLILPRYRTWLSMIRFYHRLMKMDISRLTRKVLEWDRSFPDEIFTWSKEIKTIFDYANLGQRFESNSLFNLRETISLLKTRIGG